VGHGATTLGKYEGAVSVFAKTAVTVIVAEDKDNFSKGESGKMTPERKKARR